MPGSGHGQLLLQTRRKKIGGAQAKAHAYPKDEGEAAPLSKALPSITDAKSKMSTVEERERERGKRVCFWPVKNKHRPSGEVASAPSHTSFSC